MMNEMMDAMVERSRTVDGKPTSLLDLGYKHIGLDGGWNQCFAENHTFHWASDGRPVWNAGSLPGCRSCDAHRAPPTHRTKQGTQTHFATQREPTTQSGRRRVLRVFPTLPNI